MPTRPSVPDTAVAAVRRYCHSKIPPEYRSELRVECDVRGKSITLFECRPPWHPDHCDGPGWTRQPVAQLRYEPADHHWLLYCADRNNRWRYYDIVDPTRNLSELLEEIDRDPTGVFWG